jgi:class 3 adenylate cyclase
MPNPRTRRGFEVTSAEERIALSAEERLTLLIDRLLASMDAAASAGSWDRAVELANDVLTVDPSNRRAVSMMERSKLERSLPGGQRAFVSVVFADIVQSTQMAEITEPEIVQDVFVLYRRVATETIEELGGHVLQFQGDGVVACFGYPVAHEDDARRAVLAALRLVERMIDAAVELERRLGIEPTIRVGIHSGTVVVAGLDSDVFDASALAGSTLNVAARLQGEAAPGSVVISDTTRQLVGSHFELKSIGSRVLKGIARPMEVHQVVSSTLALPRSGRDLPESLALVGREGQSRLLHFTWNRLVHETGSATPPDTVVLVRGIPGIGKSALAADLAAHVRLDGGAVLEASCSPYHGNVALWPVARMLEQLLGFYPDQPPEERLAELVSRLGEAGLEEDTLPLLAPLLGLEVGAGSSRPEVDALALRQETLRVLADWLARAASSTPTLVLLEDLHWADPTTVDLLGLLATEGAPDTMILITSRHPLDTPWASSVLDIELGPLKEGEAARLVAALTDVELDAAQRRLIVERAAGIPLFLQELTRSSVTASPGEALPPRINEILTARLRAPGIDLRIAQLAATLGVEFDAGLLYLLAGRPVDEALERLEEAALIEPVAGLRLGRYRFRHGLLRDTAYETQVLPTRQSTHRSIAELLGSGASSPGDLAVVAKHWDLAGDTTQSVPAYVTAAQAAQAAASHTEARHLLDRALELTVAVPEGDERDLTELMIRTQRTVSTSSLFGYGYPEVFEDFTVAEEICRRLTDRPEIMPAQVGIWSYLLVRGSVDAASIVLEPLANVLDDPATAWFAPEIKSCLGYSAFYQGRLEEAHRWLTEAWDGYRARSTGAQASPFWPLPHDPVPVTAVALACVTTLLGRTDESASWERRAVAAAEELEFPSGPFSLAFVTVYLAWSRLITGNTDEARAFGQRTIDIAERCRFDYFQLLGGQYRLVPEPDRPCDIAELEGYGQAMDLVGHGAFRPTYLGIVARSHHYRDDDDRALSVVGEAIDMTRASGELVHQSDLLRLRAEITAVAHPERIEEVVTDLVDAVEIGLSQRSVVLALRAANDLARLPADRRPSDWSDRIRSVLDCFPPNSSSPELAEALELLGA